MKPLSDGAQPAYGALHPLFAAYFVVAQRLRRPTNAIAGGIVINLALGIIPGIAWQAHVGGLITGGLTALVYVRAPSERRALLHPVGVMAIVLLLAAVFAYKISLIPSGMLA